MQMTNRGQWWGISLLLMGLTGCVLGGNGHLTGEERPTADFVALEVDDGIEVTVVVDAAQARKVHVEGDENLVARLRTEVEDGRTLHVYLQAAERLNWHPVHPLRVEVTLPLLEALSSSGGGTADVRGDVTAGSFEIEASGGGTVHVQELATESLSLNVSGGGDVTLAGRSTRVKSTLSGGSELHARGLAVREATLDSSGGGSTTMQVSDALRVTASGGSEVHIVGRPSVLSRSLSGGSTLDFE